MRHPHACDWCGRSYTRPAEADCVNPEHRATDETLGVREAGCGCCVVVDLVALRLLRLATNDPSVACQCRSIDAVAGMNDYP